MRRVLRSILPAVLIAVIGLPAVGLAYAQEAPAYQENFDDGQAQDWTLGPSWTVQQGRLAGESGPALYQGAQWNDLRWLFRIYDAAGVTRASFHVAGSQRYLVDLNVGQNVIDTSLQRQDGPNSYTDVLAQGSQDFSPDAMKSDGLLVEISDQGGIIVLSLNGGAVFSYTDDALLPGGYIAYEVLDGYVTLDDVQVYGAPMGARTPTTVPATVPPVVQEPVPDLVVTGIQLDHFENGGTTVVFQVSVANGGSAPTGPVSVRIWADDDPGINVDDVLNGLDNGEERIEQLPLTVPESWLGTTHRFVAEIDPDGQTPDPNRNNNRAVSDPITLPGPAGGGETSGGNTGGGTSGGGRPGWVGPAVIVGILGGLAVVAFAVTTAFTLRASRRKNWQREAKDKKPPDNCTRGDHYVEVETQITFQRLKVEEVTISGKDSESQQDSRPQTIKKKLPDAFDKAIKLALLRDEQRLAKHLPELIDALTKAMATYAGKQHAASDVQCQIHLEGIQVENDYTLYRCSKGGWKKVVSWKRQHTQQRDDPVVMTQGLVPTDSTLSQRLPGSIQPVVEQYLERWKL